PSINPDATEVCDLIDNNCDNRTDDGDPNLDFSTASTFYLDSDGDSFGNPNVEQTQCAPSPGYVANNTDCDDTSANVRPTADEVCDEDNIDEDCDGLINDADDSVDLANSGTVFYADSDSDGYGNVLSTQSACLQPSGYVLDSTDCDDNDADRTPDSQWYTDSDGDGYGDELDTSPVAACIGPTGTAPNNSDCDDSTATISPGADEYCDLIDNNCNGVNNESTAVDALTFYADADNDGFGDLNTTTNACTPPSGYLDNSEDCDDSDPLTNPFGIDLADDGLDQDCDGFDLSLASIAFSEIPAAIFTMGSPSSEVGRGSDEDEVSTTIRRNLYMSITEITQQQFVDVMGYDPSADASCGSDCPVENLSWSE
ncbi:MAG: MopE-related protein, partial [Actinomycetota bacterium]|nr:MopE-related protein [Actinomycetota bacterium]